MNYLSFILHKVFADVMAGPYPRASLAARRRVLEARPTLIDERRRLIGLLAKSGLATDGELAALRDALAVALSGTIGAMRGRGSPDFGTFRDKMCELTLKCVCTARDSDSEIFGFLRFVLGMLERDGEKSHAQLFQDYWVLYELGCDFKGYFVEFGALDGVTHSNTALLERAFGWRGVLAEPNPNYWNVLGENRTCDVSHLCVWKESGMLVPMALAGELSTMVEFIGSDGHAAERARAHEHVEVETISLSDLLDRHGAPEVIDYMSVDTEGSELEILAGFDFGRRRIRCLSVEHNYAPRRADLHTLLARNGFERKFSGISEFDDWYLHRG